MNRAPALNRAGAFFSYYKHSFETNDTMYYHIITKANKKE